MFNLVNPRFLFDTGDELDDGDVDTANRYAQYFAAMRTLTVPVLTTRGNNDRGDFGHWKTNFGPATYSITLGSFYVCMKDFNSDTSLEWFRNDYSNSFLNTNIAFRLFGQHYNSGSYAFSPSAGQYPNLMLVGHNHSFGTLSSSPYPVLSSGPACTYGGVSMFSFTKSGTNWLCPGMTNHPAGTRFHPVADWGTGTVSCVFSSPNDGTAVTNTACITNALAFSFWDGRVRFLLRKARGGYRVSGGCELAEYDYGGSNTAVLVAVDIASNTLTAVSVWRNDTDEDGMSDDWELANFTNLTVATTNSDHDSDGMSDYEEYVAGSQPTNPVSVFEAYSCPPSAGLSEFVIRWPSISGRCYSVSRSTDLAGGEGFAVLPGAEYLPATPFENSWTDSISAVCTGYYRIGVMEE